MSQNNLGPMLFNYLGPHYPETLEIIQQEATIIEKSYEWYVKYYGTKMRITFLAECDKDGVPTKNSRTVTFTSQIEIINYLRKVLKNRIYFIENQSDYLISRVIEFVTTYLRYPNEDELLMLETSAEIERKSKEFELERQNLIDYCFELGMKFYENEIKDSNSEYVEFRNKSSFKFLSDEFEFYNSDTKEYINFHCEFGKPVALGRTLLRGYFVPEPPLIEEICTKLQNLCKKRGIN